MKNWIKENKLMFALIIGILLILGISANEFLFTSDEGGITGAQAIKQLGNSFWGWLGLASVLTGVGTYFLVKHLKKNAGLGVGYGTILAILFPLMVVFGKACEGKSDGGVTTPKGRPVPVKVDTTTRTSAEDMIKQQVK
jgi:Na+/melibiose symporter-like transporter